jgi:hypothetical protein
MQQKVTRSIEGEEPQVPGWSELSVRDGNGIRKQECGAFTFWMTHRHIVLSRKPLTRASRW